MGGSLSVHPGGIQRLRLCVLTDVPFRVLCVAAFLALLWAIYRLRVRQMQNQESTFRDVIEAIPTFAWTARPDGSIEFANRYWQEYTGLSTEELMGSGWGSQRSQR